MMISIWVSMCLFGLDSVLTFGRIIPERIRPRIQTSDSCAFQMCPFATQGTIITQDQDWILIGLDAFLRLEMRETLHGPIRLDFFDTRIVTTFGGLCRSRIRFIFPESSEAIHPEDERAEFL